MKRYDFVGETAILTFEYLTGELLTFTDKVSGDNIIKNMIYTRRNPFSIEIRKEDGNVVKAGPLLYNDCYKDPDVRAKFREYQRDDVKGLIISYPCIASDTEVIPIEVDVIIEERMDEGISRFFWKIEYRRNGVSVDKVEFPYINGIYLNETWEDDTLVYPNMGGAKLENPVKLMATKSPYVSWRWQNYRYNPRMGHMGARRNEDGFYCHDGVNGGRVSMMWMDYYEQDRMGFYFASYDPDMKITTMRTGTFGEDYPGMCFSFIQDVYGLKDDTFSSHWFETTLHYSDWHYGADKYREWRQSVNQDGKIEVPEWFKKNSGMLAHYDFKYQSGEVVHRYKDIKGLKDFADELGVNHLMFAGWHKDGFDRGFPMYMADEELGTEEELEEQVKGLANDGMHISCYINTRLYNQAYIDAFPGLYESSAVINESGDKVIELYGDRDIAFGNMCPGSKGWQDHLHQTTDYVINKVGCDGMYYDQLSSINGRSCFNKEHQHGDDPYRWNQGYEDFLVQMNKEVNGEKTQNAVIYEGVTDLHGHQVCGQLASTFAYLKSSFPELYRYTFPEQILVDMIYPTYRQVMRADFIGKACKDMIDRGFLLAIYYWIYDLEHDNSFQNDPKMCAYLKKAIALRDVWFDQFERGRFMDDIDVVSVCHGQAKRYIQENGTELIAINADSQDATVKVAIKPSFTPSSMKLYRDSDPEHPMDIDFTVSEDTVQFTCGQFDNAFVIMA